MWQNLVLAGIGGWCAHAAFLPFWRRVRAGQPLRDAVTNRQDRDRRRIPRPTEVP